MRVLLGLMLALVMGQAHAGSQSGAVKIDSLTPQSQKSLNAFCNFHPQSGLCAFTPNPVAKPPLTPPGQPAPTNPIPLPGGPGGPGIPPTSFAGCGQQANLCYPNTGRTVLVSGTGQLQGALSAAQPGDQITLKGGSYGSVNFTKNGQPGRPIVIKPESGANVVFTGTFNFGGSYGVLTRVRFQGGTITMNGHHNRITRVGFGNAGGKNLIEMGGGPHMCNRIDHNEFKSFVGTAVEINANKNASRHQGHRIDHNLFYDHRVGGSEEVARMLTDAYRDSYLTYDYNLFDRVLQGRTNQSEVISVKTARATLLGNTLTNSGKVAFTFRETNRSQAVNNYIDGGAGLKVFGDDHIIKGNVFNGGQLEIRAGDGTMDDFRPGCRKSGIAPILPGNTKCTTVHAAARRATVTNNVGKIVVGIAYSGDNVPAQGTKLSNNSGGVALQKQTGTTNSGGNTAPQARKLTPADVGFSVGDASCSGN